jgi:hypothetical protein
MPRWHAVPFAAATRRAGDPGGIRRLERLWADRDVTKIGIGNGLLTSEVFGRTLKYREAPSDGTWDGSPGPGGMTCVSFKTAAFNHSAISPRAGEFSVRPVPKSPSVPAEHDDRGRGPPV